MCRRKMGTGAILVSYYAFVRLRTSRRLEEKLEWACSGCRKGWASGLADDQAIEGSDIENVISGALVVRTEHSGTYLGP